jgi:hypothetical protein
MYGRSSLLRLRLRRLSRGPSRLAGRLCLWNKSILSIEHRFDDTGRFADLDVVCLFVLDSDLYVGGGERVRATHLSTRRPSRSESRYDNPAQVLALVLAADVRRPRDSRTLHVEFKCFCGCAEAVEFGGPAGVCVSDDVCESGHGVEARARSSGEEGGHTFSDAGEVINASGNLATIAAR